MSDRETPLAVIRELTISFPGQAVPAVDRVTFEIHPGECVALVGESGSGKSLTARALLGLLPDTAHASGTLKFDGAPISQKLRGARISLVPQNALSGLDPLRRVEHEVGDALRLHRLASGAARRARVVGALTSAGMPEPERHLRLRSDELSGGLRQRALVASALIADPELIIADEPTTALDASHRARVLGELRARVDQGAAALLISHDLVSVTTVADRVLVMRDGRIIEQGDAARVFTEPQHPFTRELVAASPKGKARGTRLLAVSGSSSRSSSATSHKLPIVSPAPPTSTAAHTARPTHPPISSPPRLELRGISAAFGRGAARRAVLRDASLTVHAGETVGLVGESGSGKTTLLRIALGLQAADLGTVCIDGIDRTSAPPKTRRELRHRLALVPQDPLASFPRGAHGASILADVLRAAGTPRPERRARARELAGEVGLDPALLTRAATTLSGGQRQRLAIARALAANPALLLLDEPVSALDVTVQARVLDLLDELQARHGTAYLFVSHDEDVIAHMSDRVLRVAGGTLT